METKRYRAGHFWQDVHTLMQLMPNWIKYLRLDWTLFRRSLNLCEFLIKNTLEMSIWRCHTLVQPRIFRCQPEILSIYHNLRCHDEKIRRCSLHWCDLSTRWVEKLRKMDWRANRRMRQPVAHYTVMIFKMLSWEYVLLCVYEQSIMSQAKRFY